MLTATDLYLAALDARTYAPETGAWGGATIDPFTGEVLDLDEAAFAPQDYFVSVPGHETPCHRDRLLSDITAWVKDRHVDDACRLGLYVGLWWESANACVLDLTCVVNRADDALAQAREWGRQAVFHIATRSRVDTGVAA